MYTVKKAPKYPFLRKGMGIDLPITIAHKECGLNDGGRENGIEFCERENLQDIRAFRDEKLHASRVARHRSITGDPHPDICGGGEFDTL